MTSPESMAFVDLMIERLRSLLDELETKRAEQEAKRSEHE